MTQAAMELESKPVIKMLNDNSDYRVCYKSSRAVSIIQKMPDGKYVVVKLYDGEVTDHDSLGKARVEACSAAMTQAPRTKKAAA